MAPDRRHRRPVTGLAAAAAAAAAAVSVVGIPCSSDATVDALEEVAASASGLQDLGDGNYQFNWKAPTNLAGTCKRVRLDLFEGTTAAPVHHTADFTFTR